MTSKFKEGKTRILRFDGYSIKIAQNLDKPSTKKPGAYVWEVVSITYYFVAKIVERDGTLVADDKEIVYVTDEIRHWLVKEMEDEIADEKSSIYAERAIAILKVLKSSDEYSLRKLRNRKKMGLSDIYNDDMKLELKCKRNDICNVEKKIDLENAIKKLPQKQREVFYYRRIKDMLADDVSKILKVKKSAISRGETRAKVELRKMLPEYGS